MFPRLHVITDALDTVRGVVDSGPPGSVAVQIRVKTSDRQAYDLTRAALAWCRPAGVLCLVDDRVGVAQAAGADGVHVGAADLPVAVVRRILGPGAVIGATCRAPAAAVAAVAAGASYLGVGPAFATSTKDGLPPPIGPAGVAAVVSAVPGTPVIAIGGVTVDRVAELRAYGVAAVAAIAADPARATADFLRALDTQRAFGRTDESAFGRTDESAFGPTDGSASGPMGGPAFGAVDGLACGDVDGPVIGTTGLFR